MSSLSLIIHLLNLSLDYFDFLELFAIGYYVTIIPLYFSGAWTYLSRVLRLLPCSKPGVLSTSVLSLCVGIYLRVHEWARHLLSMSSQLKMRSIIFLHVPCRHYHIHFTNFVVSRKVVGNKRNSVQVKLQGLLRLHIKIANHLIKFLNLDSCARNYNFFLLSISYYFSLKLQY